MNPVKSEEGFVSDAQSGYASNQVSMRVVHGLQDKTGTVDAHASIAMACQQLLGETPPALFFEQMQVNLNDTVGQFVDSAKGRHLIFVGSRVFRVSVSGSNVHHNVSAYNNATFGNIRETFNSLLSERDRDYVIDATGFEVISQDLGTRVDDNTLLVHAFNTHPMSPSSRDYEEEIVYAPLPFDIQIRLNGSLLATSVTKFLTTRELADDVASKYHLNTEFYIDVDKGARVAIDRNTRLLNLGIVDSKRNHILNISLQAGEVAQRLRYICLACGDSVFRSQTDSVECRNCGSVILFKTRPQNVVTQYVAR